ncbi:Inosine/uridine-preferring nucleoside hydrolase domain-containing protein [Haematococcus lacustris]
MAKGKRDIWIDCDAGVDDAQGLLLALADAECNVLGISCVHGNTAVAQVARNVCRVLTLCERTDIPVYLGAEEPLLAPPTPPNNWFGKDGLGDAEQAWPTAQDVKVQAAVGVAAVRLAEAAQGREGRLTVIALGPLTNIALACKLDPRLPGRLERLVVMGSSEAVGNVTPTAEFNYSYDAEAAKLVLNKFAACPPAGPGPRLAVVSWECCERHPVPWSLVDSWWGLGTPRASFLQAISAHCIRSAKANIETGTSGWVTADPLAVAVALRPAIVQASKQVYCDVEVAGSPLTRGMAVYDWNSQLGQPANVELVQKVDVKAYEAMLTHSLTP